MDRLSEFLAMGGYARFVWPAYLLAALVLALMLWQSLAAYRRAQRELDRATRGSDRAMRRGAAMTRKRRRLVLVIAGLGALGLATGLVLSAFNDNLVFFYGPTELKTKHVPEGRRLRIGGLVEAGSVAREDGGKRLSFRVTDGENEVLVTYAGIVPDLFREGQGVVAEGVLAPDGSFRATSVLAKHDERYMPPEVAEALKRSGHWHDGAPTAAAGSAAAETKP